MGDENKNPLSAYGVTDKEFEYFEKFYKIEQRAFWKGVSVGSVISSTIYILVAIIK